MSAILIPISAGRFPAWLDRSAQEYASDLMTLGESAENAEKLSAESFVGAFPQGFPTFDNAVFDVEDGRGLSIGYVWVGRDSSGDESAWWIWDVVVNVDQRGKGLGRIVMQLAEEYARSHGARTMGLSVFGFNHAAQGLYESLGYETRTVKMHKAL